MNKIVTVAVSIIFVVASSSAESAPVRVTGSFGAAVYGAKPTVELPWGGIWSIPANYALSLSGQSEVLPHGLFVFASCDRFWSGSEEQFTNSAYVFSGGIGKSAVVGYSKVEVFAGLSQYNETFEVWTTGGGVAELDAGTLDGLLGLQLVFRFFDQISATAGCRLIIRNEETIDGTLSDGRAITFKTNSHDVAISFGLGYEFGG